MDEFENESFERIGYRNPDWVKLQLGKAQMEQLINFLQFAFESAEGDGNKLTDRSWLEETAEEYLWG